MSENSLWEIETEADRDFRQAFGLTVIYEQTGPLLCHFEDHPERREQAVLMLRDMGGVSTMPRRVWLRDLADRIQNEIPAPESLVTRVTSPPGEKNGGGVGFCVHREEPVTDWQCKSCFWGDQSLRDQFRDPGEIERPHRESCIEAHINAPRRWAKRDAIITRIGPMLDRMGPDGWRGVLANTLEAALEHPEEESSRALIQQIESHAATVAEVS